MLEPRKENKFTEHFSSRRGAALLSHPSPPSAPLGFTIIEALVAMMIASIIMVGLSPLVVMSVSARVQARRIDLATQAARGYIDGLRGDAIDPPLRDDANFSDNTGNLNLGIPSPRTLVAGRGITCVDKNLNKVGCGNTNKYLVIQSFRSPPKPTTNDLELVKKQGYCVGVRVYRADAFDAGAFPTQTQLPRSALSNTKDYPLAVMRAEILNQTKYKTYYDRFPTSPNPSPGELPKGSPCNPA